MHGTAHGLPATARSWRAGLQQRLHVQLRAPQDDPLARAVGDEMLKMVLDHARLGTLMATAVAVMLALVLRGSALQPWVIDLWLLAKLAVAGVRIALSLRYARQGQPGGRRWRDLTDFWLLVDGIVWGSAGLLLMSFPIPQASLAGAAMACVCCVATFGVQHSQRSTAAYVTPILVLTALGLFARGDEFGSVGGVGLLALLTLLLVTAAGAQRRLTEGLRLRLHAQALSAEKEGALQLAMRESAAKTRFLGHISHELRTPLHGILGVARLLHLEVRDARLAPRIELIESSGNHLLGLINDLLDVARLESGCFALRSERFDLAALAASIADLYAVRADEKGLTFALDLQVDAPNWVQGDPSRVRQVLHNLLGNAIKFTRDGRVTLRVTRAGATARTCFEVSDTGCGIAAADMVRLFEPFHQSGTEPGPAQEGTGLGLYIARDIARAMGGDLQLNSVVGTGTTVHFTADLPAAAAPESSVAGLGGPLATRGSPLRVLLAEDDEVNALIATAYLQHLGADTERVRDGAQAVRHALRDVDRPHLLLMDCRMPVMDGLSATREIRAQERALGLPRLPVIALTADDHEACRVQCGQAGMDGFLGKPFSKDELSQALSAATHREPLAAS